MKRKLKRQKSGREKVKLGKGKLDSQARFTQIIKTARSFLDRGAMQKAGILCRQVLQQDPDNADALSLLGLLAMKCGEFAKALDYFQRCLTNQPDSYVLQGNMGICLASLGDENGAVRHFRRAISLNPDSVELYHNLVELYERLNRLDEAEKAIQQALKLESESESIWTRFYLAKLKQRQGASQEAAEILEKIGIVPKNHPFYQNIQVLKGKVYNSLGRYQQAFAAFSTANEITAHSARAKGVRENAEKIIERLTRYRAWLESIDPAILQWQKEEDSHPVPVFLMGFPRSGTTLLDQIVSGHSQVVTLEERPTLAAVNREFFFSDRSPADLLTLGSEEISSVRSNYWQQVARFSGKKVGEKIIIDKMPLNSIYLPIIQRIFPEAKIIVCIRNPLDSCLSNFIQDFELNPFMYHFLTLEGAARFYEAVMGHYLLCRSVLPLDFLQVRYEDVVDDLAGQARKVVDFLGLAWEEGVLNYQRTAQQRLIMTPSYEQVIQPIYTKAIDRWKNYAEYFDPGIISILKPYLEKFGYRI